VVKIERFIYDFVFSRDMFAERYINEVKQRLRELPEFEKIQLAWLILEKYGKKYRPLDLENCRIGYPYEALDEHMKKVLEAYQRLRSAPLISEEFNRFVECVYNLMEKAKELTRGRTQREDDNLERAIAQELVPEASNILNKRGLLTKGILEKEEGIVNYLAKRIKESVSRKELERILLEMWSEEREYSNRNFNPDDPNVLCWKEKRSLFGLVRRIIARVRTDFRPVRNPPTALCKVGAFIKANIPDGEYGLIPDEDYLRMIERKIKEEINRKKVGLPEDPSKYGRAFFLDARKNLIYRAWEKLRDEFFENIRSEQTKIENP